MYLQGLESQRFHLKIVGYGLNHGVFPKYPLLSINILLFTGRKKKKMKKRFRKKNGGDRTYIFDE